MLTLFELIAGLLTMTAVFAWLNHRVLRLPANIGLLVMGLIASIVLIGIDFLFPDTSLYIALITTLRQIDFYDAVMNGLLAFLLFAGALHVDINRLRNRAPVIAILATVGVFISMLIVATGLWAAGLLLGLPISFAWALVFGALIAPTDPVAVLSTLKAANVPQTLETDMSGESLFNDGVGVVLFAITLQAALGSNGDFGLVHAAELLLVEAGGGAVLGLLTGYFAYRAMRAIDDYSIEVLVSLALVAGTYAQIGELLDACGPRAHPGEVEHAEPRESRGSGRVWHGGGLVRLGLETNPRSRPRRGAACQGHALPRAGRQREAPPSPHPRQC
jgi:CPA1 family monovalent cation:H+ antiporter